MQVITTLCLPIICLALWFGGCTGQYNDIRCRCTCKEFLALARQPKVYKKEALQEDCNCLNVVIGNQTMEGTGELLEQYCLLACECVYEVRSTKTMEVVVILYVSLVLLLFAYIAGIAVVDAIRKGRKPETCDEHEQLLMEVQGPSTSNTEHPRHRRSSFMMKKFTDAQDEWKKQLESQRNKVFERRNVLQ